MTIPAVYSQIPGVQFVTVWHRLSRPIPYIRISRRSVITEYKDDKNKNYDRPHSQCERNLVTPFGKYLGQNLHPSYKFHKRSLQNKARFKLHHNNPLLDFGSPNIKASARVVNRKKIVKNHFVHECQLMSYGRWCSPVLAVPRAYLCLVINLCNAICEATTNIDNFTFC